MHQEVSIKKSSRRNSKELHHQGSSSANGQVRGRYEEYVRVKLLIIGVLAVAVLCIALAAISLGSAKLSLLDTLKALVLQGDSYNQIVVWKLRMPRVLTAIVGGIGLALAGCVFQSVLRNPLASASTLGISQGAAFGASVAIILLGAGGAVAYEGVSFSNPYIMVLCAFVGAMASTLVILGLSGFREMTPESIVLAGVALAALFSGGTALIQYFAEDSQVAAVVFWTFGDLGRVTFRELAIMAGINLAGAIFFALNRWKYNVMESGEITAHGLGVNVQGVRLSGMLVAAAVASSIIAFCGIINFIGLVAPHIMRRVLGSDYRFLLPASALMGAGILLLSDIIARMVVAPLILPISAITSFIGAPLFLYLLFKGATR